ncbi:hypothetical protein ABH922_002817 [Rhodococcus sp. 27YEA15]
MPDKSDIYFWVAIITGWWFTYRAGIKHRLRRYLTERRKRKGRHRRR